MFFFVIKQSSAYSASFSGEEILLKFGCKLAPAKGLWTCHLVLEHRHRCIKHSEEFDGFPDP